MPSWPIIIRIMPIIGMSPAPAIAPPGIAGRAAGGAARMMLVMLRLLRERRPRSQSQHQHQRGTNFTVTHVDPLQPKHLYQVRIAG